MVPKKHTIKIPVVIAVLLFAQSVQAQPAVYTTTNAHSHNDYEQSAPFWLAYNQGFGSIEADIFLEDDNLYVAHDTVELKAHRPFEALYIQPLLVIVNKNNGHPYADSAKPLQLLIDIKTDSIHTLNKLITLLEQYPVLLKSTGLTFVITGNRPTESLFASYPSFIWFDGELYKDYSKQALTRIKLLSDNYKTYTLWSGTGTIPKKDETVLKEAVAKAHRLNKPVRFWNCPDLINAWKQFMELGVDYLNTDHIEGLSTFLGRNK